jgi:alpha-amylase/alpha-mannosidase (GH57 family)
MHQPLYKDRLTGKYLMPWVRLHALKDYLDMLVILRDFPRVRQTFNLVPSLLEQLVDYADRDAWDQALELLVKPVADFSLIEKQYLFERAFDLNWTHMLRPYPRYSELVDQRDAMRNLPIAEVDAVWRSRDWQDLVTWFNLAWFDPLWLKSDPLLQALVAKGSDFTMAEREQLLAKTRDLVRQVIPTYRAMAESGQVELTTTPYYHPILPLLCDRDAAHVARPGLPLPHERFSHPEDARRHIARGIAAFKTHFGHAPRGMWPSEQSVSPAALQLMAEAGLEWAISDEGVLAHTLGVRFQRNARGVNSEASALYQPYRVNTPAGPVSMVFRDVVLSDLIGFTYGHVPAAEAAADLHERLTRIRQVLPDGQDHLVTIALDGENCWEHYPEDGAQFLRAFYGRVSADAALELTTVGDYLDRHPPRRILDGIFSGSWIGSDFTTWIGDPTKNRAWDLLYRTRADLMSQKPRFEGTPAWEAAWEEIDIAEGSDWFWWFGEGHDSGQDELFDWQFRLHLQNVYTLLGLTPPDDLAMPLEVAAGRPLEVPMGMTPPSLDGRLSPSEWRHAGLYDPTQGQGAMHAAAKVVQRLHHGASEGHLYLAVEFAQAYAAAEGDEVVVYFCYPGQSRLNAPIPYGLGQAVGLTRDYLFGHAWHLQLGDRPRAVLKEAGEYGSWHAVGELHEVAFRTSLEAGLPLARLGQPAGQLVQFVVAVVQGGQLVEVLPPNQTLQFSVPAVGALA